MQRPIQLKTCRQHTTEKGEYYIANQPWNKLCKQCALNRALCGYKIQQDLSPQQFENKVILSSLTQQLKNMIQTCEKQSKQWAINAEKINNFYLSFASPILKSIDDYIQQLNKVRESISEIYENKINKKISQCHQFQSNYFMDSMSYKKHLQNLQANYTDIIVENKNKEQQFAKQVTIIRSQIQKTRRSYATQKNMQIQPTLQDIKQQFISAFKQFQSKINYQPKFIMKKDKQEEILKQNKDIKLCFVTQNKGKTYIQNKQKPTTVEHSPFFSHRKKSSSNLLSSDQSKASLLAPSTQFSHRTPNLTLKGYKRNSSVSSKSKNHHQEGEGFKIA